MSTYPDREWTAPAKVVLKETRWTAMLTITAYDGTVEEIMFSADAVHTERNGIFVGTADEAREMESWA